AAKGPDDGGEASHVAARVRQTCDIATTHRIGNQHENNGDTTRLLQHRPSGWGGTCKDQVRVKLHQFLPESFHQRAIGLRPASVYFDVAIVRPPDLSEFLPERREPGLAFRG